MRELRDYHAVEPTCDVAFNAWDYMMALSRGGVAGKVGTGPGYVLYAIAGRADARGEAYPTCQQIADDTGLSEKQVRLHISTLAACKAIDVRPRAKDGSAGGRVATSNLYTILPLDGIVLSATVETRHSNVSDARAKIGAPKHNNAVIDNLVSGNVLPLTPGRLLPLTPGNSLPTKRPTEASHLSIPVETGANAPTTPAIAPNDGDDLPEWGPAVVAPWTLDTEPPRVGASSQQSFPAIIVDPPKRDRKATLHQTEPEVYSRREAIKARYFERYTAETWDTLSRSKQTYVNDDAERIARVCADLDEAYSLMQAVWDERWSNGTYPNRAPFKLSKCPEKLKAHRDGLLTAVAATRPSNVGRPADSQVGTGRKDGLRYNPVPQYYSCAQGVGNRLGCGFAEGFPHETVTCGRTGMVTPGEDATRAAS